MGWQLNPLFGTGLEMGGGAGGGGGAATWKIAVSTEATLPTVGNSDGDARVTLDTDYIWVWDGSTSRWINQGVKAAAVGVTPNANGYSLVYTNVGGNRTELQLTLQPADATHPGYLSTTTQTIAGDKTLTGTTNLSNLTASTPLKLDASKNIISADIDLTTDVSGVLPVANGGTNSSSALSNNRILISSAGSIIEASAITGNRALASNASGIPVASAVTDTELGYLSGTTSAIQTQIDSKVAKAGDTMTGFLTLNADPTSALHAATKQYVDSLAAGLDPKASVRVATTADLSATYATSPSNGQFTSAPSTIDGVSLSVGNRVLVKNQTDPKQNGIYTYSAANQLTRSSDMDGSPASEVSGGNFTFVEAGTVNAAHGYVVQGDGVLTLNTDSVVWVQFSAAGFYTADGNGIELVGSQFQLELDGSTLSKSATGLKVATNGITNNEIAAAAAIARTKLASGAANRLVVNDASGVMSDAAAITASRALASDANGIPVASVTTSAELAFVNGVTSSIQTQIDSKVTGPASATDNALARFDGTTGKLIQNSTVTLGDTGNLSGIVDLTVTGTTTLATSLTGVVKAASGVLSASPVSLTTEVSGILPLANGGSNKAITASAGAVVYSDADSFELTTVGISGQVLKSNGAGAPTWTTVPTPSAGDLNEGSFSLANNQASAANVTGLAFANSTVRGFSAEVTVFVDATSDLFAKYHLEAIQRGADWQLSTEFTGDDAQVNFTITTAGQVQYTSGNYTGFTAGTLKYRAITLSV